MDLDFFIKAEDETQMRVLSFDSREINYQGILKMQRSDSLKTVTFWNPRRNPTLECLKFDRTARRMDRGCDVIRQNQFSGI